MRPNLAPLTPRTRTANPPQPPRSTAPSAMSAARCASVMPVRPVVTGRTLDRSPGAGSAARRRPGLGGAALPPENLDRGFPKFVRLKQGRPGVSGTGHLLAICRSVAEARGGRIWAENREGSGARFVVGLPPAPEAP
jgi:hypothetical protein